MKDRFIALGIFCLLFSIILSYAGIRTLIPLILELFGYTFVGYGFGLQRVRSRTIILFVGFLLSVFLDPLMHLFYGNPFPCSHKLSLIVNSVVFMVFFVGYVTGELRFRKSIKAEWGFTTNEEFVDFIDWLKIRTRIDKYRRYSLWKEMRRIKKGKYFGRVG
ncbi:hypothetical protein KAW18_03050 [candidate division WOR-3 bacterium]|nr:hypothetical protein [candidate division WOR-3 bacterium]